MQTKQSTVLLCALSRRQRRLGSDRYPINEHLRATTFAPGKSAVCPLRTTIHVRVIWSNNDDEQSLGVTTFAPEQHNMPLGVYDTSPSCRSRAVGCAGSARPSLSKGQRSALMWKAIDICLPGGYDTPQIHDIDKSPPGVQDIPGSMALVTTICHGSSNKLVPDQKGMQWEQILTHSSSS